MLIKWMILICLLSSLISCRTPETVSENDLIAHLNLKSHPDGGYFKEVYRSQRETVFCPQGLACRNNKTRSYVSTIYSLSKKNVSPVIHRVKSDEILHFYYGSPLEVVELDENNNILRKTILGTNIYNNEVFVHTIPANTWFYTNTLGNYSLFGSTVSPGFEFSDFKKKK